MKKYIGIDYGDVRIGIAKCDSLGILATSLCVINKQNTNYINQIIEICKEEGTFKIVIGKPLRLNGNSEIQVEKVEKFAQELKNADERIEIFFVDERYTTKEAENYLKASKKMQSKKDRWSI